MRMDHDPAPRSIFPRFGFRYWPKTVIRSKCSEWLLRAQPVNLLFLLRGLAAWKMLRQHKFLCCRPARKPDIRTKRSKDRSSNTPHNQTNQMSHTLNQFRPALVPITLTTTH